MAVLSHAEDRALRETMYRESATRASEFGKPEWDNTPLISRILHLLMIDVLAVGVAMQRPGSVKSPFGLREDAAAWISHAR